MTQSVTTSDALLREIRALIEDARRQVAHAANAGLTIAYWRIGKRLLTENLTDGRGEYGQQILASLAQQLERDYGKGFSYSALTRMARFAELFPDERILVSLIQELTWTHFIALLPLKDQLAREFYAEMCRVERWSVRTLRQKINGMLFERTALSKNSEEVVRQELATLRDGQMTPDMVFRDPYLLDFLGLSGAYSEKDLEAAILREMESFLLEMGNGFCFVERQKRMSVGGRTSCGWKSIWKPGELWAWKSKAQNSGASKMPLPDELMSWLAGPLRWIICCRCCVRSALHWHVACAHLCKSILTVIWVSCFQGREWKCPTIFHPVQRPA